MKFFSASGRIKITEWQFYDSSLNKTARFSIPRIIAANGKIYSPHCHKLCSLAIATIFYGILSGLFYFSFVAVKIIYRHKSRAK